MWAVDVRSHFIPIPVTLHQFDTLAIPIRSGAPQTLKNPVFPIAKHMVFVYVNTFIVHGLVRAPGRGLAMVRPEEFTIPTETLATETASTEVDRVTWNKHQTRLTGLPCVAYLGLWK